MKWFASFAMVAALVVAVPAQAGDIDFKPIDTQKLVVQPSKTAANLAAATINLAGQTTASSLKNNGWIKTINNVFSVKRTEPKFQSGRSALPSPNMFKSTQYKNYNTPLMPVSQPIQR